jgi:hypothetical protein
MTLRCNFFILGLTQAKPLNREIVRAERPAANISEAHPCDSCEEGDLESSFLWSLINRLGF